MAWWMNRSSSASNASSTLRAQKEPPARRAMMGPKCFFLDNDKDWSRALVQQVAVVSTASSKHESNKTTFLLSKPRTEKGPRCGALAGP